MNQKRVLIVSSDTKMTDLLIMHLEAEGYYVQGASKNVDAIEKYKNNLHDLVVVDMSETDSDCIKLTTSIRKIRDTKVVYLTEEDKQQGISLNIIMNNTDEIDIKNIDQLMDIVEKQFNLFTKTTSINNDKVIYECGKLIVNLKDKKAYIENRALKLSDMAINLLIYMILNENNYISKKELYQHVWNNPVSQNDSTVMAHIRNLRRELGDNNVSEPLYIHTKRGVGYMFKCNR